MSAESDFIGDPVTANFFLSEFLLSSTATRLGINNTPTPAIRSTLRNVLIPGMQAVRDILGYPVHIDSGYRSPELNSVVGGARNSDHMTGNAADFTAPGFGTPEMIARLLSQRIDVLKFDQLILEGSWVHISFKANPRNEVLTAHFIAGGGATYTRGLA